MSACWRQTRPKCVPWEPPWESWCTSVTAWWKIRHRIKYKLHRRNSTWPGSLNNTPLCVTDVIAQVAPLSFWRTRQPAHFIDGAAPYCRYYYKLWKLACNRRRYLYSSSGIRISQTNWWIVTRRLLTIERDSLVWIYQWCRVTTILLITGIWLDIETRFSIIRISVYTS